MVVGMPYTMFDSISASSFPASGFDATAGYVAGTGYPSSASIRKRFPGLPHLTIATFARLDAQCFDVEPRAGTPAECPAWFDRPGTGNVIYCMASWTSQVRAAMGNREYFLWSAHYTGRPHLCGTGCGYPAADATQWLDHGPRGENVDQSLLSDAFYRNIGGTAPPPPPKPSIVGVGTTVTVAAAAYLASSA